MHNFMYIVDIPSITLKKIGEKYSERIHNPIPSIIYLVIKFFCIKQHNNKHNK